MDKINWKHLSNTPGYKSLKAAYIRDVQAASMSKHPLRKKEEFLKHFKWVIGRAQHYADKTGVSIESTLNKWEEERNYWWLNFYGEGAQPKLHSDVLYPMGVKGHIKYYKNCSWISKIKLKQRIKRMLLGANKSKKKKPRWSMKRKQRGY